MNKKQILIVSYGMEIGGIERSLAGLLDVIDYESFDVDLFLFAHDGELMPFINMRANLLPLNDQMQYVKKPIVEVFKNGYYFLGFIRLWAKLSDFILRRFYNRSGNLMHRVCRMADKYFPNIEKQYDLALGFFGPFDYLLNHTKATRKIGWVHTDYTKIQVDAAYELKNWKSLDYIAAVSEETKVTFLKVFPTLKDKTLVIENILSSEFVKKQADAFDVSVEMPNNGDIRICSVGRFCYQKAFDDAIFACKKLVDLGYPVKWYLIGYGQDEALLHRLVKENKLESHFIILGKKKNPYPYMKECDIYVQPSRFEGKAVTVREAQMLGKPVLITNFPSAKCQLNNGVDGYICPMGVNGVVIGLKYLIDNSQYTNKLKAGTVLSDYSNSKEVAKIFSLTED